MRFESGSWVQAQIGFESLGQTNEKLADDAVNTAVCQWMPTSDEAEADLMCWREKNAVGDVCLFGRVRSKLVPKASLEILFMLTLRQYFTVQLYTIYYLYVISRCDGMYLGRIDGIPKYEQIQDNGQRTKPTNHPFALCLTRLQSPNINDKIRGHQS